jgi:hypothetical protein
VKKQEDGRCTICAAYTTMLVWHHTVPQAYGGVDSLQIPLCASCHTILHANADAIVAKIQSGKSITRRFWTDDNAADRAKKYVALIVNATLYQHEVENKEYKLNVVITAELHNALVRLKQDLPGVSTLNDAVLYCVVTTLASRGLYCVGNEEHSEKSAQLTGKSRSDLW